MHQRIKSSLKKKTAPSFLHMAKVVHMAKGLYCSSWLYYQTVTAQVFQPCMQERVLMHVVVS